MTNLIATLGAYLAQLPVLVAWLVGIGLALTHWRRFPRTAALTLLALSLLLTLALVGGYLNANLPLWVLAQGGDAPDLGAVLALANCVQSLIAAVAWAMLLAAIFGQRRDGGSA